MYIYMLLLREDSMNIYINWYSHT